MQNNVSILENSQCVKCKWPVIFLLCNAELSKTFPYRNFDYWEYCSNPDCNFHRGEGVYSANGHASFVTPKEKKE